MLLGQLFWQPRFDIEGHPFHFLVRLRDGDSPAYRVASVLVDQEGDEWVKASDLAGTLEKLASKIREELNA